MDQFNKVFGSFFDKRKSVLIHLGSNECVEVPVDQRTTISDAIQLGQSKLGKNLDSSCLSASVPNMGFVDMHTSCSTLQDTNIFLTPKLKAKPVFGIPLAECLENGEQVPKLVSRCVEFILRNGIDNVGILRLSGSQAQIQEYRNNFDQGMDIEFPDNLDPNVVSGVLKLFLKCIPDPVCTYKKYNEFTFVTKLATETNDQISLLRNAARSLPVEHFNLLKYLVEFGHQISSMSNVNMMTVNNVAIILGPNIFRSRDDSLETLSIHPPYWTGTSILLLLYKDQIFHTEDKDFSTEDIPQMETLNQDISLVNGNVGKPNKRSSDQIEQASHEAIQKALSIEEEQKYLDQIRKLSEEKRLLQEELSKEKQEKEAAKEKLDMLQSQQQNEQTFEAIKSTGLSIGRLQRTISNSSSHSNISATLPHSKSNSFELLEKGRGECVSVDSQDDEDSIIQDMEKQDEIAILQAKLLDMEKEKSKTQQKAHKYKLKLHNLQQSQNLSSPKTSRERNLEHEVQQMRAKTKHQAELIEILDQQLKVFMKGRENLTNMKIILEQKSEQEKLARQAAEQELCMMQAEKEKLEELLHLREKDMKEEKRKRHTLLKSN